MNATAPQIDAPLELDHRSGDGLEVWLFWTAPTDRLFVLVHDAKVEDFFEFDVDGAEALDAFRHPYAYAAFRRVSYRSSLPVAA